MNKFGALFRAFNQNNDALAVHRQGIVRTLFFLAGVLLIGTTVIHAVGRHWPLVGLNSLVAAVLMFTAWRMRDGGPPPLPLVAIALLMAAAILVSVHMQGFPGVVWSFPFVFVCYFGLPRRLASALSLLLVAGVTALAWPQLGAGVAVRVMISLLMVIGMVNVVLSVVGELQQALLVQTVTDPLTGAYNRRHLQTHLDSLLQPESAQNGGPGNALLALDIDHFKAINDRHGHDGGDEVLRRLVTVLNARKRMNDLLFRTGGEEFMLLLPRIDEAAALQMAEDLRERIAASPLLPGQRVTVSIGVSVLQPGHDARTWLKRADTALYEAKRAGRNRVVAAAA